MAGDSVTGGQIRRVKAGPLEYAAVVLLLVGGVFWLIGWFVGLAFLWASPRWSAGDKLLGSLIWPGGLAGVFGVLVTLHPEAAANVVSGLMSNNVVGIAIGLVLVLLVALPQVAVAVHLIRRARRP
jgi:hypothetical protein